MRLMINLWRWGSNKQITSVKSVFSKILQIFCLMLFSSAILTAQELNCSDGIDNDGDGLIDCSDGDCITSTYCQELLPGKTSFGDYISFSVLGTMTEGFVDEYILTDTLGEILAITDTTVFSGLSMGKYFLFHLNYDSINQLDGKEVGQFIDDVTGSCFEISGGFYVNLVALMVEFTGPVNGDTENNGGNLPNITVTGGVLLEDQTIEVVITNGTAIINDDFMPGDSVITITIPAGDYSTPQNVEIPGLEIIDDGIDECDEYFYIGFSNTMNNFSISDANASGSIDSTTMYEIYGSPPIAICDDDLTISLSAYYGGNASLEAVGRVYATSVDEGSFDPCKEVILEVRRFINKECADRFREISPLPLETNLTTIEMEGIQANGQEGYWSEWSEFIDFTSCDIVPGVSESKVLVELKVSKVGAKPNDPSGICWMEITVRDDQAPECQAPPDVNLSCDQLTEGLYLPEGEYHWDDFAPEYKEEINNWFESITYTDQLSYNPTMIDAIFDLNCGAGTIERKFQNADLSGNVSDVCSQTIYLTSAHEYCIKFPKDIQAECLEDPDIEGVEFFEVGCDLLAVSVQDQRFDVFGTNEGCYKVFRTYRVLNWCQFEAEMDPSTPLFDRFSGNFDSAPLVIGRDEDDDRNPGNQDVYLKFKGWEYGNHVSDEVEALYKQYGWDTFNAIPGQTAGVSVIGQDCEEELSHKEDPQNGYWRAVDFTTGFYQYTQVIKVMDTNPPQLTFTGEDRFPSHFNGDYDDLNCSGYVSLSAEITDGCTEDGITIKQIHLVDGASGPSQSRTLLMDEGQITAFGTDFNVKMIQNGTSIKVTGNIPIGAYRLSVLLQDNCGNSKESMKSFEVYDAYVASPVCISDISTALMPVPDGDPMMTVWASDFVDSDIEDCSGEVRYTIHRVDDVTHILSQGEALTPNFETDQSLTVTCEDLAVLFVFIYAWDEAGNHGRCLARLHIDDSFELCGQSEFASIGGVISTESRKEVEGVNIRLSGFSTEEQQTPGSGEYVFEELENGGDYTVTPYKDDDHNNGVSTFDLVLIKKHILGVQSLDSPYKLIAADANNSKSISALDLVQTRRVILRINTTFSNNTSWRFVDKNHVFEDEDNPWSGGFPEAININNLTSEELSADFVAIKVGDVSGDVRANNNQTVVREYREAFNLVTEEQELTMGQNYIVAFNAESLSDIQGFQFTLSHNSDIQVLELKYGQLQEDNFGTHLMSRGLLMVSWNQNSYEQTEAESALFSLVIRPNRNVRLSNVLEMAESPTAMEAYDQNGRFYDVGLDYFSAEEKFNSFELFQNQPNPFSESTAIGFNLPAPGEASVLIKNFTGQVVKRIVQPFKEGYNEVVFRNTNLPTGVYYYSLEFNNQEMTKRMVVVRE